MHKKRKMLLWPWMAWRHAPTADPDVISAWLDDAQCTVTDFEKFIAPRNTVKIASVTTTMHTPKDLLWHWPFSLTREISFHIILAVLFWWECGECGLVHTSACTWFLQIFGRGLCELGGTALCQVPCQWNDWARYPWHPRHLVFVGCECPTQQQARTLGGKTCEVSPWSCWEHCNADLEIVLIHEPHEFGVNMF